MRYKQTMFRAAIVVLVVSVVGCAHVKRDELQTELGSLRDELRAEYEAADGELADRIDGVDGRVAGVEADLVALDERTARLESDLQALADEFGATVERLEGAIAFSAPVHFDYDSAELREEDRPLLSRTATVLDGYYPESLVTIEGFADPAGTEAYNLALGQRRAEAVRDYLAELGIAPQRLRSISYGEASERQVMPGAYGPGPIGEPNRRVALVIETRGAEWDVAATAAQEGQS